MRQKVIYKIENRLNGKTYVGKTVNWKKRRSDHLRSLRKNNHHNTHLQAAWNKYGESNFSFKILDVFDPNFNFCINALERYWIEKLDAFNSGYNKTLGGDGSEGREPSEETRKRMSQSLKGRPFSEEHRRNISEARKGKSSWSKGVSFSEEHRRNISESHKGKVTWNKGKPHSNETRLKISESKKGRPSGRRKPVIDLESGIVFDYMKQAAKSKGICIDTLRKYLLGRLPNKTAFALLENF